MTIAVRRHFRFRVLDEFGNAIENAAVFVYQPGTTTVFTGTAYTTLSGGTTTTNPFLTNGQGEVEAWFDTPQAVDVLVTDNSDTAVRAGSTGTISFTSFTEHDEIAYGPDATDANLTDVAIAGAEDTGTSVLMAPIDHRHGFPRTGNTPSTITIPATGTIGTGTLAATDDHIHTVTSPSAPTFGLTTAGAGSSANLARQDHQHPNWTGTNRPSRTSQFSLVNSATTETTIIYQAFAANTLAAGSAFRFYIPFYTTNGAASRTLTFRCRWGANGTPSAGVLIGGAVALVGSTTGGTDEPGQLEVTVTFRTVGASGTAVADLRGMEALTVTTSVLTPFASAITGAATVDTTAQKDLIVSAAWGATGSDATLKSDTAMAFQGV